MNLPINLRRLSRDPLDLHEPLWKWLIYQEFLSWLDRQINFLILPAFIFLKYYNSFISLLISDFCLQISPPGFQLRQLCASFEVCGWLTNCLFWARIVVFCSSEAFILIFSSSSSSFNRFVLIIAWWALWGWGKKATSETSNITVKDTK